MGTLIDYGIMLAVGCYATFARETITRKIADNSFKKKIDATLKFAGPALIFSSLVLIALSFALKTEPLQKVADAINARTPTMIDSETRLDNVVAGPGKRLTYNITLITYKANQISRTAWETKAVPVLRANLLANPKTSILQKEGVTVVSRYSSSDGILIDELVFDPQK